MLILEGILLEYKSGLLAWLALTLWSIEYYLIRDSVTVSVLFLEYKIAATLGCWAFGRESSDVFLCLGFL